MGEQKVKTLPGDEVKTVTASKKAVKKKGKVASGIVFINSTYNNTIITITDETGNALAWASAGMIGFKGSKKSTPYAAQRTMEEIIKKVKDFGMKDLEVFVRGVGSGRDSAIRALNGAGIVIKAISDRTPTPHGGVRKKKPRRV